MAYAKVEETFWHDQTVRGLSEPARHLYLYLLTCPHRNRIGCFVLDPWYASADLQWSQEQVADALAELAESDRIGWDPPSRVVFIRRFLDYNTLENKKVVQAATSDLRSLPDNPFLADLLASLEENQRAHYVQLLQALSNRIANSTVNRSDTVGGTVGDTRAFLHSHSHSQNHTPPTADAVVPPAAAANDTDDDRPPEKPEPPPAFRSLLPEHPDAAEALAALTHRGGHAATAATLRTSFLYLDDSAAMPDPSVNGLPLEDRQRIVAQALLEMRSAGNEVWNSAALAGFARNIASRAGPSRKQAQSNKSEGRLR